MKPRMELLDQDERIRQKQEGRDRDAARLASGETTREQLRRENGFFSALPLKDFRVVAIGGKPVGSSRKRD